ncbi:putative mitochondrial protein [Tanacetum coccineum]
MGLTLYLGIERGNIACHKSEARFGTLLREGRLASRAFRDEAFWRSQVNFGPPNPATDEKALWYGVKGRILPYSVQLLLLILQSLPKVGATYIFCDSNSAVMLSRNPVYHGRTKHVEIKHHFIRKLIEKQDANLKIRRTEEKLADVFTKSLSQLKHEDLCSN